MPFITTEVIGKDRVLERIRQIGRRVQDLTPFWRDVFAPKFFAAVQDMFATGGRARGAGGRFAGGAWPPLAPVYAAWKARHFPGQPILVRTGALRESLMWRGGAPGDGGVFQPTARTLNIGTSVKYAAFHQTGTSRMPARRFMEPPDPTVWTPILAQWLKQNAK